MSVVEARDYVLWPKHIHGNPALRDELLALEAGALINLVVDGVVGTWEKRNNGKHGAPTPGLKALGVARKHWHGLFKANCGAVVNIMKSSVPVGSITGQGRFRGVIFGIFVLLSLIGPPSHAQDEIKQVTTPAGLLVARQGSKTECRNPDGSSFDCQVLDLNGRILFRDAYVNIIEVVPNKDAPLLIIGSGWAGGNQNRPENYLLDFTKSPPLFVKKMPYYADWNKDAALSIYAGGITYKGYADEEGSLGEPIWRVYRYKYGSGAVEIIRSTVQYNFEPLKSKKYPDDLLNDPVQREPLLKIIGRNQFKKFRQSIGLGFPIEIVADRFIIGSGCERHNCGSNEAIFVIDSVKHDAWAVSFTMDYTVKPARSNAKLWGRLTTEDFAAKSLLTRWMTERGLTWTSTVYVPYTAGQDQTAPYTPGKRTEVPLVKSGGIFTVPVLVNGIIPLSFMVDSGASDMSIPADVVLTLLRTGTLTDSDFIGTTKYRLADGSIVPSTTFRLRTVKVGDRVIENVVASMTGVEGSLLLGQSFLSRFERWSINNARQALELE